MSIGKHKQTLAMANIMLFSAFSCSRDSVEGKNKANAAVCVIWATQTEQFSI
jgi:hypothetical protein